MRRSIVALVSLCVVGVALFAIAYGPATRVCQARGTHVDDKRARDATQADALRGLWSRHPFPAADDDAAVAFWYFHDDGIGLYRYGRVGHNTTNSYDYAIDGGTLRVTFRKTGEVATTPFVVEGRGDARVLVLQRDPRSPEHGEVRYAFVPPPAQESVAPDLLARDVMAGDGFARAGAAAGATARDDDTMAPPRAAGRLWIDQRRFATGGSEFSLWQLRPSGMDGRGTGWHHVGDFDDWSTEALSYRETGPRLDGEFGLRHERFSTSLRIDDRGGARVLTLREDPRGFWASRSYRDAGPSFGAFLVESVHAGAPPAAAPR